MTRPPAAEAEHAEIELSAQPANLRLARAFAVRQSDRWLLGDASWAVALAVAELTTNAVVHAMTPFSLELIKSEDEIQVRVRDGSDRLPTLARGGADDDRGRGLRIVQAIARSWGVVTLDSGKVVWCRLATDGSSAPLA